MPDENKYTALLIDQIFELLKQLFTDERFTDERKEPFFTSNRTLYQLFNGVQGHFAQAFPRQLELVTMRRLRNKANNFRQDLLKDTDDVGGYGQKIRIIPEEVGKRVLDKWCKPPEFEE